MIDKGFQGNVDLSIISQFLSCHKSLIHPVSNGYTDKRIFCTALASK